MDLSKCNCDKAGFCPVFGRDIDKKNHEWCNNTTVEKRQNYYRNNNLSKTNLDYIGVVKKSYHIPLTYVVPENIDEIEIVTFHFNLSKSKRLKETYEEWIKSLGNLGQYVKCYEIVFDDAEPEIENSIVIKADSDKHCLWQKEPLLNLAFRNLEEHKKYFCWIDHDLVFKDRNWLKGSIDKLKSGHTAVQLFEEVIYLDKKGIISHSSVGRAKKMEDKKVNFKSRNRHGSPGGAWIARVDKLQDIFPTPTIITGSGDEWLAYALYGSTRISPASKSTLEAYPKEVQDFLISYVKRIGKNNLKISHQQGICYHLWHGDAKNRQYMTRHKILEKYNFDPRYDMFLNKDGILELTGNKKGIEKDLLKYFIQRKEDG